MRTSFWVVILLALGLGGCVDRESDAKHKPVAGSNDSPVRVTGGSLEIRSVDFAPTTNVWNCKVATTCTLPFPQAGAKLALEEVTPIDGSTVPSTIDWTKGEIDLFMDDDPVAGTPAVKITWNQADGFSAVTPDAFLYEPAGKYHASRIHHQRDGYPALHTVVIKPGDGSKQRFICTGGECRIGFGGK
jgi:hypothetical protein